MKAVILRELKGLDAIRITDIPLADPNANEIQVKVAFAGVNPVDWKIAEGLLSEIANFEFPVTLGWDFSGTVTKTGSSEHHFKEGDAVYGLTYQDPIQAGTYAEYINVPVNHLAAKPANLSFEQASVIPLSALTAWQGLHEMATVKKGEHILIHAGAGGVGGYAIQLAKLAGATVLTTCSESNTPYVRSLGADEVIDYQKFSFQQVVKEIYPEGLSGIFDTVGYETLKHDYDLVKKHGWLVSIVGLPDVDWLEKRELRGGWMMVKPNGSQLQKITQLIELENLQPPELEVFALEDCETALIKSRHRHLRGKLTLRI